MLFLDWKPWIKPIARLLKLLGLFLFGVAIAVATTYLTVPTHNTGDAHFDTLVVLGSPPDPDGSPSSEERERVMEAVREYRSGRAAHMIMTGGAAHSRQAESEVMATVATSEGVPRQAVIVESQAKNTIENIYYSRKIMERSGWTSAEVVSSPSHLPRVALILEHYKISWRTKAARWPPEYSQRRIARYYVHEVLGTTLLRWFGFRASPYIPEAAVDSRTGGLPVSQANCGRQERWA